MTKSIAIIPARGGSKRIPRKNIRDFLGKPIIAYSIEAALTSTCFDEVMVSTDDPEVAAIAAGYGADVPFMRSADNSNDHATTAAVIEEVLQWYRQNQNKEFQFFCCIYATAPFVTARILTEASRILADSGATSVIPVTAFSYPVCRSLIIENGKLQFKWPEYSVARSQDLQPAYHDTGQFYFTKTKAFFMEKTLFTKAAVPIIVNEAAVQDIDNEDDWKIAEIKYRLLLGEGIIK
jgi:pseudaminic acid cytidylyltransferase